MVKYRRKLSNLADIIYRFTDCFCVVTKQANRVVTLLAQKTAYFPRLVIMVNMKRFVRFWFSAIYSTTAMLRDNHGVVILDRKPIQPFTKCLPMRIGVLCSPLSHIRISSFAMFSSVFHRNLATTRFTVRTNPVMPITILRKLVERFCLFASWAILVCFHVVIIACNLG